MAILFYKKKKREIYLGILIIVLILAFVFLWFKFLRNDTEEMPNTEPSFLERKEGKIQIDFEKLENQILQDLEFFSPILPVSENLGRENPFATYIGTSTLVLPKDIEE